MDLYRINLNLLIALDQLLTEKSVTKAAEKLSITQAAMSNNLQQLRELFSDALLVREKHHMLLTPYARELHPKLQQIIEEVRTLIVSGQRFCPEKSERVFKIGVPDYMAPLIMPKLLTYLHKRAPGIKIVLTSIQYLGESEPFEKGDYDLAIGKLFTHSPSVQTTLLLKDSLVCILNPKHTLANKKKLSLEDYIQAEHIAVCADNLPLTVSIVEQALAQLGIARNVKFSLPFIMPIFKLIEKSTTLLGTVTKSIANLYRNDKQFLIKSLPFSVPEVEFYLAWHQRSNNDLGHRWLRELILQTVLPETK
ncbi:MAG: pcpR [Gammaproteobacteria bacterium]|jgi:DNA-binding transcriptional LysR family regulator|nr:pcpR [Gammaproteobacteria bacterium]